MNIRKNGTENVKYPIQCNDCVNDCRNMASNSNCLLFGLISLCYGITLPTFVESHIIIICIFRRVRFLRASNQFTYAFWRRQFENTRMTTSEAYFLRTVQLNFFRKMGPSSFEHPKQWIKICEPFQWVYSTFLTSKMKINMCRFKQIDLIRLSSEWCVVWCSITMYYILLTMARQTTIEVNKITSHSQPEKCQWDR